MQNIPAVGEVYRLWRVLQQGCWCDRSVRSHRL